MLAGTKPRARPKQNQSERNQKIPQPISEKQMNMIQVLTGERQANE
jgi:hypothetical protein